MIRLLHLLIVCLGLGQFAAAQTYQRLIQPDKYWEIMWCDRTLICNVYAGFRQYFEGDTLINGQTYAKMYGQALISPWGTNPYCPPFGVSPNSFLMWDFLREDTVAQRIYRYEPNDGTETLVFDLTMEVGDTWETMPGDIVQLDSITTDDSWDGFERRVFHFELCKFVEGIGTVGSWGVFGPPSMHPAHCSVLYCFEHIGFTQGGCSGPLSTYDQSAEKDPAPHPNPASDLIHIPSVGIGPAQVFIHDQLGRLVLRHDRLKGNANVDIRALHPGTYSYRVLAPDGSTLTGRFEVMR